MSKYKEIEMQRKNINIELTYYGTYENPKFSIERGFVKNLNIKGNAVS